MSIVLVACPDCGGTGNDDLDACRFCLGQKHVAVDRPVEGAPMHPDGRAATPWVDAYPFPEVMRG